jgi:hypothetical protein
MRAGTWLGGWHLGRVACRRRGATLTPAAELQGRHARRGARGCERTCSSFASFSWTALAGAPASLAAGPPAAAAPAAVGGGRLAEPDLVPPMPGLAPLAPGSAGRFSGRPADAPVALAGV